MTLTEYRNEIFQLPFGKRLPTAVYVHRELDSDFGPQLNKVITALVEHHALSAEFNVIKFKTDELKISFLSYPDFLNEPHPALRYSVMVDLVTGRTRRIDYIANSNPPILHRKEKFLPEDHPSRAKFEALTRAEEGAGLYEHVATIGFKLNWERLLADKGVEIHDHVVRRANVNVVKQVAPSPLIERHKTALTRYELSKPVKSLLEFGLVKAGTTLFDYGCGQGSDLRGLQALGFEAEGWDPVYRHAPPKREADIVNMGYVLNVIEDPAERLEALVDAHRYSRRLLVVSGLIRETVESDCAAHYRDGVVTRRNTFQKFFEQQELQQYIEDALETTAVPVALGIFYVFRNPIDLQDFLSARSRRVIDWNQISVRLGLGRPQTQWKVLYDENKELLDSFGKLTLELGHFPNSTECQRLAEICERLGSVKRALRVFVLGSGMSEPDWDEIRIQFGIGRPPKRLWEIVYEKNRELLDSFWSLMLQLGRLPNAEEFPRTGELQERIGSVKHALRMFLKKGGREDMNRAIENRRRDLLVYVALANLRKRVPFGHLSVNLRADIRAFFRNYTRAMEQGVELLYAAGDVGEIQLACDELKIGWQDEQALYVHRSLLGELPPVLRAYVGCGIVLFGDVAQADVIKVHKESGKVTFLAYDDFESNPLPVLRQRVKVNLRTRWVQVFDHSSDEQILYFKERFLGLNHPHRNEMMTFSRKLAKLGLSDRTVFGPTKSEFEQLRSGAGLNDNLNKRRGKQLL